MTKKETKEVLEQNRERMLGKDSFPLEFRMDSGAVYTVNIRIRPPIEEERIFVDRVANACFDDEGDYHPEMREDLFGVVFLEMFTDMEPFHRRIDNADENGKATGGKFEILDINKNRDLWEIVWAQAQNALRDDDSVIHFVRRLHRLVNQKIQFCQARILSGEKERLAKVQRELNEAVEAIQEVGEQMGQALQKAVEDGGLKEMFDKVMALEEKKKTGKR